jgi:branched-chain amino acid transport system substrate-binding protein
MGGSMRRFSRLAAICAMVALAPALASCGDDDGGGSSSAADSGGDAGGLSGTIPVTFVGDMTGPVAYVGKEEERGMRLAVEEVNASGMLGDAKLELKITDTGSNQNTAVTQMNEAVASDAVAIFGPLLSNEALASAPIAQRAKVPYIATQSQNDGTLDPGEYIYRLTTSQLRYDNMLVNKLAEEGAKTVNLVHANDNPTLVDVSKRLLPEGFEQVGITPGENIGIPTATTDFGSVTTKLMSGNPDAIGLMLVGAPIASAVKALRTAGYEGIIFSNSAATAGSLKPAGKAAEGVFYAVDFTEDLAEQYPSSKQFVDAYKKANPDLVPYGYNASGYDAVKFLAEAIKASGDASREGVLKGMQQISQGSGFDGAVGPVKFTDPDQRDVAAPGALVEWRNGRETLLEPGNADELVQSVKPPN